MHTAMAEMESRLTLLNKVPEVTIVFWIIKIMSTTVGETGADYLAVHVGLGATVTAAIMVIFLIAALIWQLRAPRYTPWVYWLTVVLVSVVGTQITDFLTDKLEISLYVSTATFAVLLALTFAVWYSVERTLSIHTIVTTRRELFYWGAILSRLRRLARCSRRSGNARACERPLFRLHALIAFARAARRDRRHTKGLLSLSALLPPTLLPPLLSTILSPLLLPSLLSAVLSSLLLPPLLSAVLSPLLLSALFLLANSVIDSVALF